MGPEATGHAADAPLTLEAWGALSEDVRGELVDGRLEDDRALTWSPDAWAWSAPTSG